MKTTETRILALLAAAAAMSLVLSTRHFSQQAPPSEGVIRINVNLVQVDAVVTDSKGKPVTDLKAEDFEVFQDGKPQPITNFVFVDVRDSKVNAQPIATAPRKGAAAPPPPLPSPPPVTMRPDQIRRTIAVVVDDLGLSFDSTVRVRESLKKWVDTQMQPGDLVAIIRTSAGMGALQQFSADKRILAAAIDAVRFRVGRVGVSTFAPLTGASPADAIDTTVFDDEVQRAYTLGSIGAIQYVIQGLRDLPGRKSLVLFSESMRLNYTESGLVQVATPSSVVDQQIRRLVDAANRSSVVMYAIDPRGVVYTGLTAEDNTTGMTPQQIADVPGQRSQQLIASQDGMIPITQKTGGLFIQGNNDLAGALRQVVDDGDGYYLIGYRPDDATFEQAARAVKFHNIAVRVKRPGLRVRSRTGFFGMPDAPSPAPATRRDQIVTAIMSPFTSNGVPLRLTTLFSNAVKEGSYINALLYFEAQDLAFSEEQEGQRKAEFDIVAATFDAEGVAVDSSNKKWTLTVTQKGFDHILKNGLVYSLHVPVKKPGAYQMRTALRDSMSGRLGTATQFIEVPDLNKGRLSLSGIALAEEQAQTAGAPEPSEGAVSSENPHGTPAVRIFKPGASIIYAYQILNAHAGGDKKVQLEVQTRVFREGQPFFTSQVAPINDRQENPKRLISSGRLRLGSVPPGHYALQLIVTDKLAKEKYRIAAQSMDFEVQ